MRVEVRGADGVHKMLQAYTDPTLKKRLQKAMTAGAKVFVAPLRAEAAPVSKRMARAATQNASGRGIRGTSEARKTSRGDVKAFAGYRIKRAFFSHFVVGGTQAHVTRGHMVRGVTANPMVSRVAERYESTANRAIDASLDSTEPK